MKNMTYQPTPREQFYIQLAAGILFAVAGYTWYSGAPTWTTALSGIAGLIAQVLTAHPSIAVKIPQSIVTNSVPITPIPRPPYIPTVTVTTQPQVTVTTRPVSQKKIDPITQV